MDWREEIKLKQKAQEYYEKDLSYNQVYIQGYSDGYAKAIDEFAKRMKELIYKWIEKGVIAIGCIDEIAEQMKGGATDERTRSD